MTTQKAASVPRWLGLALGVALTPIAAWGAREASVRVDVHMSQARVLGGRPQTVHLYVGLTGRSTRAERRAPLNVAIVLDRSGSMSGRKLEEARRAAIMAIERLQDDDIVSVVTYESTVDVLVPATKARDRDAIARAIRSIEAGGSTALFAGVSKGADELRKFLDRNRVNTLLLLSDGLANVGPSSPGDLAQLGASLARQGIAVTTIGLGLGYNEDLMTRLAGASDGNHFFVEEAGDLRYAFAREFGDALSAVAQGVDVHIRLPLGVRPLRALGREAQISGRDVYASFGQVFNAQTRYLLLEVEVPAGRPGARLDVAEVDVTYHDLLGGARATARGGTSLAFTDSLAAAEASRNRDVMVEVVRQIAAERAQLAVALRDAGKIEQARAAFQSNTAFLESQASKLGVVESGALSRDISSNSAAEKNVSNEDWKRERKAQQEYQSQTVLQRGSMSRAPAPAAEEEQTGERQQKQK
jgi:Ca-activated chloride channel family protein